MKRNDTNIVYGLCDKIAQQNGLIFEIGGDSGEGFFIKFGIPSDVGYEVEYVQYDPVNGKDNDLLMVIPKIYKAARNLIAKRADIVSDAVKNFADFKE